MDNGRKAETRPNEHVSELLSFIDSSLDDYKRETNFTFDSANKKNIESEEDIIKLKKKFLRLKKAFEIEKNTKESEIKILRERLEKSKSKNSRIIFLGFSWLLFLTVLFLSAYK